jgi:hypothetical protein
MKTSILLSMFDHFLCLCQILVERTNIGVQDQSFSACAFNVTVSLRKQVSHLTCDQFPHL